MWFSQHAHTDTCTHHSPVLRKSKIAVSLNSFPLAARPAFVLQTKRKRKRQRAQQRREKEGDRAKEHTEEEDTQRESEEEAERERRHTDGKMSKRAQRKPSLCPYPYPSQCHHM